MNIWTFDTAERLSYVTRKCRPDMHEPDEQDIEARPAGFQFDNAFGDHPLDNNGELTIGLKDASADDVNKWHPYEGYNWFNLATLIAFARIAATMFLELRSIAKQGDNEERRPDEIAVRFSVGTANSIVYPLAKTTDLVKTLGWK